MYLIPCKIHVLINNDRDFSGISWMQIRTNIGIYLGYIIGIYPPVNVDGWKISGLATEIAIGLPWHSLLLTQMAETNSTCNRDIIVQHPSEVSLVTPQDCTCWLSFTQVK